MRNIVRRCREDIRIGMLSAINQFGTIASSVTYTDNGRIDIVNIYRKDGNHYINIHICHDNGTSHKCPNLCNAIMDNMPSWEEELRRLMVSLNNAYGIYNFIKDENIRGI